MRQPHVVFAILVPVCLAASPALAQAVAPVVYVVSGRPAVIEGLVRDEDGRRIAGARIVAQGATVAFARTDASGRFAFPVPVGDYVLRVTREGYVSAYREAVTVAAHSPLRRTITLVRTRAAVDQTASRAAGAAPAESPAASEGASPGETAWRLRHLPRTVLRDESLTSVPGLPATFDVSGSGPLGRSRARWELSDLTGRVDLLTTSAVALAPGVPVAVALPHGIAYMVVGAPVGHHGAWSVRTAVAPGDASAWTLRATYDATPGRRHQLTAGVSYVAQTLNEPTADRREPAQPTNVRRFAGVHVSDRWAPRERIRVHYGARLDRADFLSDSVLSGGAVGVEHGVSRWLAIAGAVTRHRVAPGAWLPPESEAAWLPPDRTFSSIDGQPMRASTVDRRTAGVVLLLGRTSSSTPVRVTIDRVRETTRGQAATVFASHTARPAGHFYVAPMGHATLDGVGVGVTGAVTSYVRGRVDVMSARVDWPLIVGSGAASLARQAEALVARRIHDVTSSVDAFIPGSDTTVHVSFRLADSFFGHERDRPGLAARFAFEVRQPLVIRAVDSDGLTLFLAARTLQRDLGSGGYFDDLTTVSAPLRVTGGIQVRF
jgi:hypothetical protein